MSTLRVTSINSYTANTPPIIRDSAGTEVGTFCRAWVNFDGTGVVAIRQDFNVTSITDIALGTYTVNFTTAMPDGNYAVTGTCVSASDTAHGRNIFEVGPAANQTTTSSRVLTGDSSTNVLEDFATVCIAYFR